MKNKIEEEKTYMQFLTYFAIRLFNQNTISIWFFNQNTTSVLSLKTTILFYNSALRD